MYETIPPLSSALRRLSTPATYWAEAEYVGRRGGGTPTGVRREGKRRKKKSFSLFPCLVASSEEEEEEASPIARGGMDKRTARCPRKRKGNGIRQINGNPCNCTSSQERGKISCFYCANLDCLFLLVNLAPPKADFPMLHFSLSLFPLCLLPCIHLSGKKRGGGGKISTFGSRVLGPEMASDART